VKIYSLGIGSLFNPESVASSLFKDSFFNKLEEESCLSQSCVQQLYNQSKPSSYDFAIAEGVSRRWTYPSGAPWGIIAVSAHKEKRASMLGGLEQTTRERVAALREREADYDYLVLNASTVSVYNRHSDNWTTLQERDGKCTPIFAFAYGYSKVPQSVAAAFKELITFAKHYERPTVEDKAMLRRRRAICAALPHPAADADCGSSINSTWGHVLAQSYIDVTLNGLLVADDTGSFAKQFVETTIWPVDELAAGQLYYINDRRCPQNPNPVYTPTTMLAQGYAGGTSGVWQSDPFGAYKRIDELLPSELIKHRISGDWDCGALGMGNKTVLTRWTDEVVYGPPRYLDGVRVVTPWQAPFML